MVRDLVLQTKQTSLPEVKGWKARRASISRIWQLDEDCITIERSLAWFRYLVECPEARVEEGVLEYDGQTRGHFLTARRGSRIRIVDLVAEGTEQVSALSACLRLVRKEGASEAQVCSSLPSRQRIFEACGMSKFREEPVWIADPKNRLPKQLALDSFLTGDAFYV